MVDLNATQAAVRAGYSQRTADVQGPRLLENVGVARAIDERKAKLAEKTGSTTERVLACLWKNYDRAMQEEPVRDKQGNPTGEYTYQGSVANRSLELIGKHAGMFADNVRLSGPDGGPIKHKLTVEFVEAKR